MLLLVVVAEEGSLSLELEVEVLRFSMLGRWRRKERSYRRATMSVQTDWPTTIMRGEVIGVGGGVVVVEESRVVTRFWT